MPAQGRSAKVKGMWTFESDTISSSVEATVEVHTLGDNNRSWGCNEAFESLELLEMLGFFMTSKSVLFVVVATWWVWARKPLKCCPWPLYEMRKRGGECRHSFLTTFASRHLHFKNLFQTWMRNERFCAILPKHCWIRMRCCVVGKKGNTKTLLDSPGTCVVVVGQC